MKTNCNSLLTVISVCVSLLGSAPVAAAIPGIPGLPGAGGGEGGDINSLFDTYITSYVGMLEGQAGIAGALGLTELQGKYAAEAGRLKADKGKNLDAAQKLDKEGQKQLADSMAKADKLEPDKQKLLAEGTLAYAVGALKLAELVKQAKNVKKPGITDIVALPKFKMIQTLPEYIKNVVTLLPTYAKFMEKVGVQPNPKMGEAMKALPSDPS